MITMNKNLVRLLQVIPHHARNEWESTQVCTRDILIFQQHVYYLPLFQSGVYVAQPIGSKILRS